MSKRIEIESWGNGYVVREFTNKCKECNEKHWRIIRETKFPNSMDKRINPVNRILMHIKSWLGVK